MNEIPIFQNMRFARPRWSPSRRLITVLLIVIVFCLFWRFIPHTTLVWLLAPCIAAVGWMATYGWRQALSNLIEFLSQLEQS